MRKIAVLLLTAAVAALSSCAKKNVSSNPINLPGNAKAYVAGSVGDTAVYFINGKEYPLTSGKDSASANGLAVVGSDVYVAGYESNGAHTVAKYWKNGQATVLSDTSLNAAATAIAVAGSDVYVSGWIALGPTNAAVVWKNGNLTHLTATGHGGAANALCLDGSDVYVAGYDSTAGHALACYWKNGALNTLTDSLPYAVARGIAVSASDVYVAGWDRSPDGYTYIGPRLWKNGQVMQLPTNNATALTYVNGSISPNTIATSITVTGNTSYVTGEDFYHAVYWENGNENIIDDGYQCNAVALNNGDVYFAGGAPFGIQGNSSPTFWRNGVALDLDFSAGMANAIVVTN